MIVHEYDYNTLLYMACTFFSEINEVLFKNNPSAGERAQLVKYLLDMHEDLNSAPSICVKCWMLWRRSGDAAVRQSLRSADHPAQPNH